MTFEELEQRLKKYGLRPDKKFGQNFLTDESVLEDMIAASDIHSGDLVLEVGPGVGNLTELLAKTGALVTSVEKDERFGPLLADVVQQHPAVQIVFADIMRFDFVSALEKRAESDNFSYRVVANIPYYVTGKLLQLLLRARVRPKSITVLVQKEVAQNMVASPGNMNLLGLSVQLMGTPRLVRSVPARSFFPAPKVDSAVVHVDMYSSSPFEPYQEKELFRVARACFSGKRKQIHNSLAAGLRLSAEETGSLLASVGILPTARPQDLSVEQFVALTRAVAR
jgi:16S rRNA (adenine1518-N6/adenine1519-N6)-dimethyltransferase